MVTCLKVKDKLGQLLLRLNRPIESNWRSWLGNVYRFADHQAAVKGKHQNDWVELKDGALGENAKWDALVCPVL